MVSVEKCKKHIGIYTIYTRKYHTVGRLGFSTLLAVSSTAVINRPSIQLLYYYLLSIHFFTKPDGCCRL